MGKLTIKVVGVDDVIRKIEKDIKITNEKLSELIAQTAFEIKGEAVKNISRKYPEGAVDTGQLRNSIVAIQDGSKWEVGVMHGTATSYARVIEFGRQPGKMPPIGNSPYEGLWRWVIRHTRARKKATPIFRVSKQNREKEARSIAFAVAKAIEERGTRPKPYLLPAYQKGVESLIKKLGKV